MLGIKTTSQDPINAVSLAEYFTAYAWTCRVADLKGQKLSAEPKPVDGLPALGLVSDVHDYGKMWNLFVQMHREMFGGYGMVIYHFWMRFHGQALMDVAYSDGLRQAGIGALSQTGAEKKHQQVRRRVKEACGGTATGQKRLRQGPNEPVEVFEQRNAEHNAELQRKMKSPLQEVVAAQFRDLNATHGDGWRAMANASRTLEWCAPVGQGSYLELWGREGQITDELLERIKRARLRCVADMRELTSERLDTCAPALARFDARGFQPGAGERRARDVAAAEVEREAARAQAAADVGSKYVAPRGLSLTARAAAPS